MRPYHLLISLGALASWIPFNASGSSLPKEPLDPAIIRQAVEAGLRLIEKSAAEYPEHRSCFSCHHQTLPMQASITARAHGFRINENLLSEQANLTHASFKARHEGLEKGTGIGGRSMTVGFGLWALDLAGWERDQTTKAMVGFLLNDQKSDGHFGSNVNRPPLEDSTVTSTVLAAYYMDRFAEMEQRPKVDAALKAATAWLQQTSLASQEDRNSKLWGLRLLERDEAEIGRARQTVLDHQRPDGGWAQLDPMEPDAYATGQTLFMLRESGLSTKHAAYQAGVRYLLRTQLPDGSWLVKTRSKAIQTFFESGFPHGTDQFISICATSWAVAALAPVCEPKPEN